MIFLTELCATRAGRCPTLRTPGRLMRRHGAADSRLARACAAALPRLQYSCRVGRYRISLMSISAGWLIANATARAKESAGTATCA